MSEQKHTPTPWKLDTHWSRRNARVFVDIGGLRTSFVECSNPADASLIVRACNSHEQLVAALIQARSDIKLYGELQFAATAAQIDAALAAAGAK